MKAETSLSQFRAAVWKKHKRDEKGSGSGEDDEGDSEMIVHVPKAVEKRIRACVLMDPELGNMTVTRALAVRTVSACNKSIYGGTCTIHMFPVASQ
jgi:hypothetical protein